MDSFHLSTEFFLNPRVVPLFFLQMICIMAQALIEVRGSYSSLGCFVQTEHGRNVENNVKK
jgi:hypothetical protein